MVIVLQTRPDHGAYSAAHPFLNNLPAIIISLPGQQRTLSTQQATDMSLQHFAALYTVSQGMLYVAMSSVVGCKCVSAIIQHYATDRTTQAQQREW